MKKNNFLILSAILSMLAVSLSGCGQTAEPLQPPTVPAQTATMEAALSDGETLQTFHGSFLVDGKPEPFTLSYRKNGEAMYSFLLSVFGENKEYPLRDDFNPASIEKGFSVQDVNQDGQDDLLIELGIYGRGRGMDCLIFTQDRELLEVPGFRELFLPHWAPSIGMVVDEYHSGAEGKINHYCIQENRLVLMESLSWEYIHSTPVYRQEKRINGAMVPQEQNLRESEIDFDYWSQP